MVRQIGPSDKAKRKDARIGSILKGRMVSEGMQAQYRQAVALVLNVLLEARIQVPSQSGLDPAVGAWSEGEHKSTASDALADLHYYLPQSVGLVKHSLKLARVWQKKSWNRQCRFRQQVLCWCWLLLALRDTWGSSMKLRGC